MKRIAFFVEGQTEQIFVNRLIKEILGTQRINIFQKQLRGGINIPKEEIVRSVSISKRPLYEALIIDCGADNRVKSEVLENIENLRKKGHKKIVGMRDLYPFPIEDLGKLKMGLKFLPNYLKNNSQIYDIVIAVHEVEAWFLGEVNHFKKIDKRLTGHFIESRLGFNPYAIAPDSRVHPAKDLDDIYRLVGKSYTKRYDQTIRIVNKLDFNYIINNLRYRVESLDKLITLLENFKNGI